MKHTTHVHVLEDTLTSHISQKNKPISLGTYKKELLKNPRLSGFNGDFHIEECKPHSSCYCLGSTIKPNGGILVWDELNIKTACIDFILFLNPHNPNYRDRPYSLNMFHVAQTLVEFQTARGAPKTVGTALADKIVEEIYGTCVSFDENFQLSFDACTLFSTCRVERGYSIITKKQNSLILAYPNSSMKNQNPYIKLCLKDFSGGQLNKQERSHFFALATHLHEQLTKAG